MRRHHTSPRRRSSPPVRGKHRGRGGEAGEGAHAVVGGEEGRRAGVGERRGRARLGRGGGGGARQELGGGGGGGLGFWRGRPYIRERGIWAVVGCWADFVYWVEYGLAPPRVKIRLSAKN
jgi:hypothetical protein